MDIKTAYHKGLDDAENIASVKLNNAIRGIDDGPFNNPKMEELRQLVIQMTISPKNVNPPENLKQLEPIEAVLLGEDYYPTGLSLPDMNVYLCIEKLVELVNQCVKKKTKDGLQMAAVLDDFRTSLTNPQTSVN